MMPCNSFRKDRTSLSDGNATFQQKGADRRRRMYGPTRFGKMSAKRLHDDGSQHFRVL
jgi:hypothetical protein